jgi:homoserine dehydrogenase
VDDTVSSYYLRLCVDDRPGVIASIAGILAKHGIGILSMSQPEVAASATQADLMLMLHKAPYGQMKAARDAIASLDCVKARPVLLRVESLPGRKG